MGLAAAVEADGAGMGGVVVEETARTVDDSAAEVVPDIELESDTKVLRSQRRWRRAYE